MGSLVATPDVATGTIRVDVDQKILLDLFGRVVANGWGSPDVGPAWVVTTGPAADFSVSAGQGRINNVAGGVLHVITNPNTHTDFDITYVTQNSVGPGAGEVWFFDNRMREQPGDTYVSINCQRRGTPDNNYTIVMSYAVSGVILAGPTIVVPDVTASSSVFVRFRGCGNTLQLKAWGAAFNEPTDWNATFPIPTTFSGTLSLRTFLQVVGTALPISLSYDNMVQVVGQPIRLYRVTPDGARTEVIGSPAFTEPFWPSAAVGADVATFWDSTAPFDVDVYYELSSNCTDTVALTSNTVNLDSDGDGWLRDPLDPAKNFRIIMEDFFDDCLDQDVVVFSGLSDREYENASGIFDHIDARRPITISMTRKNYASVLQLTSFSLDDVDMVEDIFDQGRILSLSLPMEYGWAHRTFGTDFITIFDVIQSLIGIDQRVTTRVWTVPFRLSPEPADPLEGSVGGNGIGGGGATYDNLAASVIGTTYNSLTAAGFTYTQIAQGVGY